MQCALGFCFARVFSENRFPLFGTRFNGREWTDDAAFGGSGVTNRDHGKTELAQNTTGSPYAIGSLTEHEGPYGIGGHTIEKHVGKSDSYLLRRLLTPYRKGWFRDQYYSEVSTFYNLSEATKYINSTLSDLRSNFIVDSVVLNRTDKAMIWKTFTKPVGFGFVTNTPNGAVRDRPATPRRVVMYSVGVVIKRDPNRPKGFYVLSAYPIEK